MHKKSSIKSLFLFCLISNTASHSMEKEIKDLIKQTVDQIIPHLENQKRQREFKKAKKISNFRINASTLFDPIMNVVLENPINHKTTTQILFIRYSQQNIAYATLLTESLLSVLLGNQIAKDYKVLRAAQNGETRQIRKLASEGANCWQEDKRRIHATFNLVNREGGLCTKTDIEAGNLIRLALSNRPIVSASPYSCPKDAFPFMYAVIHNNLNTVKILIKNSPLDESSKQEIYNKLDERQSAIDDEQQTLQIAQTTGIVPTLSIDADCDTMPKPRYVISSCFNRGMKIQYHIDADRCDIGAQTDRSTWTHPHPDLKTLAFFYTKLIANNKHEGKKIVDAFDAWNEKFPHLSDHIIGNLLSILEAENFDDQQLITAHLISLAQKYIPQLPQSNSIYSEYTHSHNFESLKDLKVKQLLGEVLSLTAGRTYDASGKLIDATSKKMLDKYMKQLNSTPNSKQLFRLICDANPHLTTVLKSAWQQIVLREFLTRTLLGNSDLQEKEGNIVAHIVSFWEPDTEFKKGL